MKVIMNARFPAGVFPKSAATDNTLSYYRKSERHCCTDLQIRFLKKPGAKNPDVICYSKLKQCDVTTRFITPEVKTCLCLQWIVRLMHLSFSRTRSALFRRRAFGSHLLFVLDRSSASNREKVERNDQRYKIYNNRRRDHNFRLK